MFNSLLAVTGLLVLAYVISKVRRIDKDRDKLREELRVVYSVGLKNYKPSLNNPDL